jgi:hypothetical protein
MIATSHALLAYVDPATGALVLQAAIAGVLAAGVVFRRLLLAPFALLRGRLLRGRRDERPILHGSGAGKET